MMNAPPTRMTRRDQMIARVLAQVDQVFEDKLRESWTRIFEFAESTEGEVMLENCDEIEVMLRAELEKTRAQITQWFVETYHEDGTPAVIGS